MKRIYENKKLLLIIVGIIVLIFSLLSILNKEYNDKGEISINTITKINETTTIEKEKKYIDIKGSVKKPGVYEFKENDRVIDAIEMAGGLKKNANTDNINLSEKLKSEMVIYVYSESEIKKGNNKISCDTICQNNIIEVNNCVENENSNINDNNNLVNINTATINELLTLSGIGETKAQNIIDYRMENGNFKSIEEIKNVSGIGDALYEKIKDRITV